MGRRRNTSSVAAVESLREVLSAAFLGDIIRGGIGATSGDPGELALVRVRNADADESDATAHVDTHGARDVWIHTVDELAGTPQLARLHIPGNVLFVLPDVGDTALLARPHGAAAPGAAYLFHGDAGTADRFPPWLDASTCGLYTRKVLRLESAADHVVVEPGNTKKIRLGVNANKAVGLHQDAVHPTTGLPGAAFATWIQQVETFVNGVTPGAVVPFVGPSIGTLQASATKVDGE